MHKTVMIVFSVCEKELSFFQCYISPFYIAAMQPHQILSGHTTRGNAAQGNISQLPLQLSVAIWTSLPKVMSRREVRNFHTI